MRGESGVAAAGPVRSRCGFRAPGCGGPAGQLLAGRARRTSPPWIQEARLAGLNPHTSLTGHAGSHATVRSLFDGWRTEAAGCGVDVAGATVP